MNKSAKFLKKYGFKLTGKVDELLESGLKQDQIVDLFGFKTWEEVLEVMKEENEAVLLFNTSEAISFLNGYSEGYSISMFKKAMKDGLITVHNDDEYGKGKKNYFKKKDVQLLGLFLEKTPKDLFRLFKDDYLSKNPNSEQQINPIDQLTLDEVIDEATALETVETRKTDYAALTTDERLKIMDEGSEEEINAYMDFAMKERKLHRLSDEYRQKLFSAFAQGLEILKNKKHVFPTEVITGEILPFINKRTRFDFTTFFKGTKKEFIGKINAHYQKIDDLKMLEDCLLILEKSIYDREPNRNENFLTYRIGITNKSITWED